MSTYDPAGLPPSWYPPQNPQNPQPQAYPYPEPERPPASRGSDRWLPVVSLMLSLLSVVGMLSIGAWVVISQDEDSGIASSTLTGHVLAAPPAAVLPGSTLATVVTDVIEEDGAYVTEMRCPATPRVIQGVVTVCHGTIDDEDWAVVVFFENERGAFTLQLV
jgi:hypothetical protein